MADNGLWFWEGAARPSPPARGPGGAVSSSVGSGAKPQPPRVLMLFVFSDDLSCYGKSGPQKLGGLGSLLSRLNPRFLRHCADHGRYKYTVEVYNKHVANNIACPATTDSLTTYGAI